MQALVVRINNGEILVADKIISCVGKGIALFLGLARGDTQAKLATVAQKVENLRIFESEDGKLNYSIKDKNYQILCISNFTLCASTSKGRRPSFEEAMAPDEARKFFDDFILLLQSKGLDIKKGVFGAHMDINLNLDGPVNIVLEA